MSESEVSDEQTLAWAAEEELGLARCLSWRELKDHVPYGDAYEGFDPSGGAVEFERAYLWKSHEGGDILLEVTVRRPGRGGPEAKAACLICENGCGD